MVVYYCRFVPHAAPEPGRSPLPRSSRPAQRRVELGHLVDFIVVTSNFVHLFESEIEQAAGRELLSMVDLTLAEVARRAWRNVGVLGFGDPLVYTDPLPAMHVRSETIDGDLRSRLDTAIDHVMEGRAGDDDADAAREALAALRTRKLDGIVVGCTEIRFCWGRPQAHPISSIPCSCSQKQPSSTRYAPTARTVRRSSSAELLSAPTPDNEPIAEIRSISLIHWSGLSTAAIRRAALELAS